MTNLFNKYKPKTKAGKVAAGVIAILALFVPAQYAGFITPIESAIVLGVDQHVEKKEDEKE